MFILEISVMTICWALLLKILLTMPVTHTDCLRIPLLTCCVEIHVRRAILVISPVCYLFLFVRMWAILDYIALALPVQYSPTFHCCSHLTAFPGVPVS